MKKVVIKMLSEYTERTEKVVEKVIDHLSESPYFYVEVERDYKIFLYNISLVNNLFHELLDDLDNTTMNLNLAIIRNLASGNTLEVSLNRALMPIVYNFFTSDEQ